MINVRTGHTAQRQRICTTCATAGLTFVLAINPSNLSEVTSALA